MNLVNIIIHLRKFCFVLAVKPSLAASSASRFLSRGHTYRVVVGETLVLPCEVENLGKLFITKYIYFPFGSYC